MTRLRGPHESAGRDLSFLSRLPVLGIGEPPRQYALPEI